MVQNFAFLAFLSPKWPGNGQNGQYFPKIPRIVSNSQDIPSFPNIPSPKFLIPRALPNSQFGLNWERNSQSGHPAGASLKQGFE